MTKLPRNFGQAHLRKEATAFPTPGMDIVEHKCTLGREPQYGSKNERRLLCQRK